MSAEKSHRFALTDQLLGRMFSLPYGSALTAAGNSVAVLVTQRICWSTFLPPLIGDGRC